LLSRSDGLEKSEDERHRGLVEEQSSRPAVKQPSRHSSLKRRNTLFPSRDQKDAGSLALHTFYQELKQLCQLKRGTSYHLPVGCSSVSANETPSINTQHLQSLIKEGAYESAQYQLYLTELKRIVPDVTTDNLIINGLYQLTKSRVREDQGTVYGDQREARIDVGHVIKSHGSDCLILVRYWKEPSQIEETGVYNAIGSSFMQFIYEKFGSLGLRQLVFLVSQNHQNPEQFVFKGYTISELEFKWRKFVENLASSKARMSVMEFIGCLFVRYYKPYLFVVLLMILFSCCDVTALLGTSFLIGRLFEIVADSNSTVSNLISPGCQLMTIWCFEMVIALIHVLVSGWLAVQVSNKLRVELFSKIHHIRPVFFLNNNSASVLSCFSSDIDSIELVMANTLTLCLQASLLIATSLGFLLFMEWRVTLGLIMVVMTFQIALNVISRKASYHQFNKSQCLGKLLSMMKENVEGYQVSQLYQLGKYWTNTFQELVHSKYTTQAIRSLFFTFSLQMTNMLYPNFVVIVYLVSATVLIKLGLFEYSEMLTMYMMAVFSAIGAVLLGRSMSQVSRAAMGMGRLQAFLNDKNAHDWIETDSDKISQQEMGVVCVPVSRLLESVPWKEGHPTVELLNVSFCYHSHSTVWNLYDISLSIPFGQSVALVGSSGSGKSTLLSLIMNMYNPSEGTILVDGQQIQDICPEDFPFGVALQENYLFNTTLYENIRMGRLDATDIDVYDAAKAANIHQFIMELPLQYNTLVGERGTLLSGGQRQRIALARMLIRQPKILLLDEVTSSLDAVSEQKVFATIKKLFHHHTVIYVTHKLSQAQSADRIVVLSHGKIKEDGNHNNLMEKQGAYYHMWQEQQLESTSKISHVSENSDNRVCLSDTSTSSLENLSDSYNAIRNTGSTASMASPQILSYLLDVTENGPTSLSSDDAKPQRSHSLPTLPHLVRHQSKSLMAVRFSIPHLCEMARPRLLHQDMCRRAISEPAIDVSPICGDESHDVEKGFTPIHPLRNAVPLVSTPLTIVPDWKQLYEGVKESEC
jgi:subfamily B ATP-binding cassette protein MsbA